ncbi:hypothetical protein FACHB389_12270 [Nostoc calcicola FACHB-389]|nr:hypothetical protein FACHB389_12270 [Nostoc calcicola FACHB-389]
MQTVRASVLTFWYYAQTATASALVVRAFVLTFRYYTQTAIASLLLVRASVLTFQYYAQTATASVLMFSNTNLPHTYFYQEGEKGKGEGVKEKRVKLFPIRYKAPILIAENIKRRFRRHVVRL